jgi:DNA invertase Pin-like site-specific DNA recombinase
MGLAMSPEQSVHGPMAQHVIYIRRSYKEATAADVSDEHQEAACRRLLPPGATVRVISDSGGHQSGFSAARDGYQALLAAIAAGEVTTLLVYDLSRLARNARLMLGLAGELERRRVPLLVANLPGASFDGANGRYMFGQLSLAAQLQRDLDSELMTGIQRRLFGDGRHRGHDPLGYAGRRDAGGQLTHPRELVMVPDEAAIVRRVWAELADHSLAEVAEGLDREGVAHRGPWTREAVKDIWRRGRFYLGFVVEKRGRDERPGRHEAILTEAQYARTTAAIGARRRLGSKPKPFRTYALRGLLWCTCGTRLRGEAHVQRGTERRYYRCPTLGCKARRCPADAIELEVLARIGTATLPERIVDAAQAELRQRLQTPDVVDVGRQRARLTTRLEQIRKQNGWGDLPDADYLAERDAMLIDRTGRDRLVALPADGTPCFPRCPTRQRPDPFLRRLPGACPGTPPSDQRGLTGAPRGALPDRHRAGCDPRPLARLDCVDTVRSAVLRKTAGVPPRGFEPLISTLKGWRPRPLDDEGEAGPSVAGAPDGSGPRACRPGRSCQPVRTRNRMTARAMQPAATSDATPPTMAWPKARASLPPTLERQAARAPTAAIAMNTRPRTTRPEASSGICEASRTLIA